jgi:hypothetical protein
MDILSYIFGGLGGAILTGLVTYIIYRQGKEKPTGKAYEILKELGKKLEKPRGEY